MIEYYDAFKSPRGKPCGCHSPFPPFEPPCHSPCKQPDFQPCNNFLHQHCNNFIPNTCFIPCNNWNNCNGSQNSNLMWFLGGIIIGKIFNGD